MELETELFEECKSRAYNCSLTWQSGNDYSVEIYTGYKKSYQLICYTDGHIDREDAINKTLQFLKEN